jgi:hypothetical protein
MVGEYIQIVKTKTYVINKKAQTAKKLNEMFDMISVLRKHKEVGEELGFDVETESPDKATSLM